MRVGGLVNSNTVHLAFSGHAAELPEFPGEPRFRIYNGRFAAIHKFRCVLLGEKKIERSGAATWMGRLLIKKI